MPTAWSVMAAACASNLPTSNKFVSTYTAAAWYVPTYPGAAGIDIAKVVDISKTPNPNHSSSMPVAIVAK